MKIKSIIAFVIKFLLSIFIFRSISYATILSFPKYLSQWGLFAIQGNEIIIADNIISYDLSTALFTDYASKWRLIRLPKDKKIQYNNYDTFDFPEGTVIAKTFAYPVDEVELIDQDIGVVIEANSFFSIKKSLILIETRILFKTADGWLAVSYLWDRQIKDAKLTPIGRKFELIFRRDDEDVKIKYMVPNVNQCKTCHARIEAYTKKVMPIGPSARFLNRTFPENSKTNQLQNWKDHGIIEGLPDLAVVPRAPNAFLSDDGTLEERARAYLDINCAHCHRSTGFASSSGLLLGNYVADRHQIGLCKSPVAAGNGGSDAKFDIEPKKPDKSLLYQRLTSTDPSMMMPELGRSTVDLNGSYLIREWITSLDGDCLERQTKSNLE